MGNREIREYDDKDNLIYWKNSNGSECWQEFDENNNKIYHKDSGGWEYWYKWDNEKQIIITEQEYKEIEFRKKEKEYLNRTKCSRFELIDI